MSVSLAKRDNCITYGSHSANRRDSVRPSKRESGGRGAEWEREGERRKEFSIAYASSNKRNKGTSERFHSVPGSVFLCKLIIECTGLGGMADEG